MPRGMSRRVAAACGRLGCSAVRARPARPVPSVPPPPSLMSHQAEAEKPAYARVVPSVPSVPPQKSPPVGTREARAFQAARVPLSHLSHYVDLSFDGTDGTDGTNLATAWVSGGPIKPRGPQTDKTVGTGLPLAPGDAGPCPACGHRAVWRVPPGSWRCCRCEPCEAALDPGAVFDHRMPDPVPGDRCRRCGETVDGRSFQVLAFADGSAAHEACEDRWRAEGVVRRAGNASTPEALADEAELTIRGEMTWAPAGHPWPTAKA
jgi:hypothetical protein